MACCINQDLCTSLERLSWANCCPAPSSVLRPLPSRVSANRSSAPAQLREAGYLLHALLGWFLSVGNGVLSAVSLKFCAYVNDRLDRRQ